MEVIRVTAFVVVVDNQEEKENDVAMTHRIKESFQLLNLHDH